MSTTFVAIGDSTVEGLDDPDGQGGYRGWADRLAEHLAHADGDVRYANLAVRGRTSQQVRDEQLSAALALQPDVVASVCGVNDLLRPSFSPPDLERNLDAVFGALRTAGARVVTYTQPDPVRLTPLVRPLRRRVFALNAVTRAVAARHEVGVLDLEPVAVAGDPRLWSADRLHANSEGHRRIAAGLADLLGLPGDWSDWTADLAPVQRPGPVGLVSAEAAWLRQHLGPFLARRLRGRSSGEAVLAKLPEPVRWPVRNPTGTAAGGRPTGTAAGGRPTGTAPGTPAAG